MSNIDKKILYINWDTGNIIDDEGAVVMGRPSISYGSAPVWQLNFVRVNNDGTLSGIDLSNVISYHAAVDTDFLSSTMPMIRTLDDDIDHSQAASGIISVSMNAGTTTFFEKVDGKNSIGAYFEVRGNDSNDKCILDYRFNVNALGAVDPQGGDPVPVASGGVTLTDVYSLLRASLEYEFSSDGTNWHSTQQNADTYYRTRYPEGEWGEAIKIQNGQNAPNLLIKYSADGTSYHTTPTSADYYMAQSNNNGESWVSGILFRGADGANGVGYELLGAYNASTTYHPVTTNNKYECVTYEGSTYAYTANAASSGNLPTNTAYWTLIAAKGDTGSVDNITTDQITDFDSTMSSLLSGYAKAGTSYTTAQTDSLLAGKANASDVYTISEADDTFVDINELNSAVGNLVTVAQWTSKNTELQNEIDYISGVVSGGGGGDLSNYYTKSEVNSISAYLQNEIDNIPSGSGSGISGVTFNGAAAPIVNNAAVISALPIATVMPDPAKTDQQFMLYLGSTTSEYSDPLVSYDLIAPSFTFYEAHSSTGSGRVWSGTDALDYNQFKIKWGTSGWILQKYPNDPEHFNDWYDCGEQISSRISGEPFGYWKRDIYNEETGSVLSTQYFNVNNLSAIQVKKGHLYEKSGSLNDNVLKVKFGDYGNFYTLYKVQSQSPGTDNIWTDTGNDGTGGSNYYQKLTWSGGPSGHWIWENDEGTWYNSPNTPICNPWDMDGTTWTEPNTSDPMTAVFHIERAFNGGWADLGSMLN